MAPMPVVAVVGMTIDGSGNAYILGLTTATDFPISDDAYQKTNSGGRDYVVFKLDTTGSDLLFSTYLGGQEGEDFYSGDICLDQDGNIIVAGVTLSSDYPVVQGCYDTSLSGQKNTVIVKLNSNASKILAGTYLGGTGAGDMVKDMEIDDKGKVYLVGNANSADFPTTNDAYQARIFRCISGVVEMERKNLVEGNAEGFPQTG